MLQGACQLLPDAAEGGAVRLAPFWHTRALVLLLLAVAAVGSALGTDATPPVVAGARLANSYLPLLLVNAGLAAYVSRFERGVFWRLVGVVPTQRVPAQLGWAALLLALILGSEAVLTGFGMPESLFAHAVLPTLGREKAIWLLLATLIGCAEELVYRGYLRQQLAALSGSAALGILLQAFLFGVSHGEQGPWAVARFAAYGVAFGCVAARERTIVPCVLCHVPRRVRGLRLKTDSRCRFGLRSARAD